MGWNGRDDRIAVFNDTEAMYKKNETLKAAVKKSIAEQQLILEDMDVPGLNSKPVYDEDAQIIVSKKRSFEAASAYTGKRVCVLNFASATNPGGGVKHGSSAQEECLCRCSTLYPCINERTISGGFHYYHRSMLEAGNLNALYNDDCIYTPGVIVFKTDESLPKTMPENDWYTVDIITCAAPNLRERPSNSFNPNSGKSVVKIKDSELRALHEKRADRILDIAKANHAEVVILGAFGCGAFQNPPAVVADGIHNAVKKHLKDFETIEFAVYCSGRDTENHEAFSRRFKAI